MKKKKFGRILLSSSVGVKFGGSKNSIIYSLTKHMNEFFFTSFKEFFEENILINSIRIGITDTKIHKKNRNVLLANFLYFIIFLKHLQNKTKKNKTDTYFTKLQSMIIKTYYYLVLQCLMLIYDIVLMYDQMHLD